MSEIEGYAVSTFGKVSIRTVSDTPRAAMVNWLVTVPQVMVLNSWTDEFIAEAFDTMEMRGGVQHQGRASGCAGGGLVSDHLGHHGLKARDAARPVQGDVGQSGAVQVARAAGPQARCLPTTSESALSPSTHIAGFRKSESACSIRQCASSAGTT